MGSLSLGNYRTLKRVHIRNKCSGGQVWFYLRFIRIDEPSPRTPRNDPILVKFGWRLSVPIEEVRQEVSEVLMQKFLYLIGLHE